MKATAESRILEIPLDAGILNVITLGRAFEDEVLKHHLPTRTQDRQPVSAQDGAVVFAWSDTFKEYVIAPSKVVAAYPRIFTHWLPRSVIPDYQKVAT